MPGVLVPAGRSRAGGSTGLPRDRDCPQEPALLDLPPSRAACPTLRADWRASRPGPTSGSPGTRRAWPSPSRPPGSRALDAPETGPSGRTASRSGSTPATPATSTARPGSATASPPRLVASGPRGRPRGRGVQQADRPRDRRRPDLPPRDILRRAPSGCAKGWRLELFLPAEALHGFDPETNRRLGFAYQVTDPDREDQFLGVGREFPVGENPSLWSTLELRD